MDVRWRIELLGGVRAVPERGQDSGLRPQEVARFRTRKVGALLAFLAYHLDRRHPRDTVIDLLWPDSDVDKGRHNLSNALSSLREQFEPPGVPRGSVILGDHASVGLNAAAVTTDAVEFEAALRDAERAADAAEKVSGYTRAVELYRGELCHGYYETWMLPEQRRLADAFSHAIAQMIRHMRDAGDLYHAIDYACRGVNADPLREEAHLELIRLYRDAGQWSVARRQYREMARILKQELGEGPSRAARELGREIERLAGEAPERASETPAPSVPRPSEARSVPSSLLRGTMTFLLTAVEDPAGPGERAGEAFRAASASHHFQLGANGRGGAHGALARAAASDSRGKVARSAGSLPPFLALLRREFRQHGGHEVRPVEGGFLVAFQSAGDALGCAVAAQRALTAQTGPAGTPPDGPAEAGEIRMRTALYTGEADLERSDSCDLVLDQASRLVQAAHGRQILCSELTAGLLQRGVLGAMEPGLRLVDLGVYRLPVPSASGAGATTPERLFQVEYPGMAPRPFAALKAHVGYAGNVPLSLTRFFGREREIPELLECLNGGERLVTLTGLGGSGKTRLALEVARQLVEPFRGEVWFVPLADLADPQRLVEAVRDALQLPRLAGVEPLEQVVRALSHQPALLVLDNLERGAPEGGSLVRTLLGQVPTLTCLVTSRRRLRLPGEREFLVEPLPVPGESCQLPVVSSQLGTTARATSDLVDTSQPLSQLTTDNWQLTTDFPSVQLFVDRARAVRPDFQLTPANASAVAALCRRLEGIPLAIELAAGRAQALTPAQILSHLERRFDFLVRRHSDIEARHLSLRAAMDGSYELLSPELQRFFARLSVFRGGWTLEAAEAVCVEGEPELAGPALDYLEQLRECSLVSVEDVGEETRYRLMETLREYGRERLAAGTATPSEERGSGRSEAETVQARHQEFLLGLAERAEPHIIGAAQQEWLERLEREHDNLRAALEWCRTTGDVTASLRFGGALWRFWFGHGHLREGRRWLEDALAAGRDDGTPARLKALLGAGTLAFYQGEYDAAAKLSAESLEMARARGDRSAIALSLVVLGWVELDRGTYDRAKAWFEESLAISQHAGDDFLHAMAIHSLGSAAHRQGQYEQAASHFQESLSRFRQLGDTWGVSLALEAVAHLALHTGDDARVTTLYEEVLELSRKLGHTTGIAGSLRNRGVAAGRQGEYEKAAAWLREGLALYRAVGGKQGIVECLEGLAEVTAGREEGGGARWAAAARLFGAAEALREALGAAIQPYDRGPHDRSVVSVRAQMGEAEFAAAWAAGRGMTLEQAVAEALEEHGGSRR